MKGRMIICIIICLWLYGYDVASAQLPNITAEAAVLMDLDTGEVLYGKQEHQRRPPASLTKVMTGYLATKQSGVTSQSVVVSETAAKVGESSLNLSADDVLQFEQLLYGALLNSCSVQKLFRYLQQIHQVLCMHRLHWQQP